MRINGKIINEAPARCPECPFLSSDYCGLFDEPRKADKAPAKCRKLLKQALATGSEEVILCINKKQK